MPIYCAHENFNVQAVTNRLTPTEGAAVNCYTMDITVQCADCGTPFQFIGVDSGFSPDRPMSSVDMLELSVPIVPQGEILSGPRPPGFVIRRIE